MQLTDNAESVSDTAPCPLSIDGNVKAMSWSSIQGVVRGGSEVLGVVEWGGKLNVRVHCEWVDASV